MGHSVIEAVDHRIGALLSPNRNLPAPDPTVRSV
jgi:hypothetical protein